MWVFTGPLGSGAALRESCVMVTVPRGQEATILRLALIEYKAQPWALSAVRYNEDETCDFTLIHYKERET